MRNKFENWNLFKGKGLILELIFGVDKSLTFIESHIKKSCC